tara:strand:- start:448 stop:966 length:519 start_codon:yes stop_codon:yes gene_type:complete
MRPPTEARKANGFTLSEVMITVVIVGILSAVALPNYFRQVQRTKQSEATATLAQIQTIVATYIDEYNLTPTSWKDLSDMTAIMTTSGPADLASFESIILPGGNYTVSGTTSGDDNNYFEFTATPVSTDEETLKYNVMACIDLENGASDLKQGNRDSANKKIESTDLVCQGGS